MTEIKFYQKNEPHYEFSNYWGKYNDKKFKLHIDGYTWPSVEHYYQANKFRPEDGEYYEEYYNIIRETNSPYKAFLLGRIKKPKYNWTHCNNGIKMHSIIDKYKNKIRQRDDWEKYDIQQKMKIKDIVMLTALREKFKQNKHLRKKLLETGNKKLMEYTEKDLYWGTYKGKGQNMLGILLMKVRDEIQNRI